MVIRFFFFRQGLCPNTFRQANFTLYSMSPPQATYLLAYFTKCSISPSFHAIMSMASTIDIAETKGELA